MKALLPKPAGDVQELPFSVDKLDGVLKLLKQGKQDKALKAAVALVREVSCYPGCQRFCKAMESAAFRGREAAFREAGVGLQIALRDMGQSPKVANKYVSHVASATSLLASQAHLTKFKQLQGSGHESHACEALSRAMKSATLSAVHEYLAFDETIQAVRDHSSIATARIALEGAPPIKLEPVADELPAASAPTPPAPQQTPAPQRPPAANNPVIQRHAAPPALPHGMSSTAFVHFYNPFFVVGDGDVKQE